MVQSFVVERLGCVEIAFLDVIHRVVVKLVELLLGSGGRSR